MKCLAIGGEPATGKTTLMREIMRNYQTSQRLKYGKLYGHLEARSNVAVLGVYDGQGKFQGTDRLSMAVNKDFLDYASKGKRNLLFEGDRLFSASNLRYLSTLYQMRIIILEQGEGELTRRHEARGDTQSDKFLKGRKTKINNIKEEFAGIFEPFRLNEISDTVSLSTEIWDWIAT